MGSICIPAGTVIDGNDPQWNGVKLPMPMPINSIALDEEAALAMLTWYGEDLWHRLVFGPGLDPDAIKARAAGMPRLANRHGW